MTARLATAAIAVLAISAAAWAQGPAASPAASGAEVSGTPAPCEGARLVSLDRQGRFGWLDLPSVSSVEWETLELAWLFAPDAAPAPVRLDRSRVALACAEPSVVEIAVAPRTTPLPIDLEVVAAPLEAWQQLPESFLPRWPIRVGELLTVPMAQRGITRLRLRSKHEVGDWVDLEDPKGLVQLRLVPTAEIDLVVVDERGRPVAFPGFSLFEGWREPEVFKSLFRAGPDGRTRIAIPADRRWRLVVAAAGFLPAQAAMSGATVSNPIVLEAGCDLQLEVVDWRSKPIADATVGARAARGRTSSVVVERRDRTDANGHVRIGPLPVGRVDLAVSAEGFATDDSTLVLPECPATVDLASITLVEAETLVVRVEGPDGVGIEGATLRWGNRRVATAADGLARLESVAHDREIVLTGEREGFEPVVVEITPPFQPRYTLTLEPQPRVTGRVVDARGEPLAFTLRLLHDEGRRSTVHQPAAIGVLDLPVPIERPAVLEVASPSALPTRVEIPSLPTGVEWPVGDVVLSRGLEVVGRLVDDRGEGIAGARLWATRADPTNEMLAWYQGNVAEATSGVDGAFHLSGLPDGPGRVRIDAHGRARASRSWSGSAEGKVDLGNIELVSGATVWVHTDSSVGGTARVDPGRAWRDLDMVTAPVVGGVAEISAVPRGTATVSIEIDGQIYCETSAEVPASGEVEVSCLPRTVRVRGQVVAGGAPAGPGRLIWRRSEAAGDAVIVASPLGGSLARYRVLGGGPPAVEVAVQADGRFASQELTPAVWEVGWNPIDGSWAAPQSVTIPDLDAVELRLELSQCEVRGVVRSTDGEPVHGAVVSVDGVLTRAETSESGAYLLVGLAPGSSTVRAAFGAQRASATVDPGDCERPVELELELDGRAALLAVVVTRGGRPAPGSLVVAEMAGLGRRVLTTDLAGRAELELDEGASVRLAAQAGGVWALTPWSEATAGATELEVPELGWDLVVSASETGPLVLEHPSGWDLAALLRTFGRTVDIGTEPTSILGLPPGTWVVGVGDRRRVIVGEPRAVVEVDFD